LQPSPQPRCTVPLFPTRRSSDLGAGATISRNTASFGPTRARVAVRPQAVGSGSGEIIVADVRAGAHIGDDDFAAPRADGLRPHRSEEHTSQLQSRVKLVCRLLLE